MPETNTTDDFAHPSIIRRNGPDGAIYLKSGHPLPPYARCVGDWLPWSHTFGGNFTTNMALRNGGAIYIDAGKPAPDLIETTIRNIKDVRPLPISFYPRQMQTWVKSPTKPI